jgi:NAD(P)H-flavin reductase
MNSVSHFLWLDIELPLNRAICPGQHVQLWMPRAGFRAFFQLPRFYVAFWENGPTQIIVRMVAEPQPGLTQKLYHQALKFPAKQSVMILGPYGHPLDFYRFGTILFVVEDIGFFRALSYIEMLVEASCRREVMVLKLEVLWKRQVGKDGMFLSWTSTFRSRSRLLTGIFQRIHNG